MLIHLNKFKTPHRLIKVIRKSCYSTKKDFAKHDIDKIRNIGILAHIDAGKTTTTERMLFYSGTISQMGEVHHGNTVTDYMPQERDRGITIKSAAVTFPWKKYQFNLIDTPGHIDFTMEVEQTLNALDGAIVILDGSAGVEAQTLTVWRQGDRYNVPRIIFVNKMDRADANFEMSCKSIENKLGSKVLPLQIPTYDKNNKFNGVVDILTLNQYSWDEAKLQTKSLTQDDGFLWEQAIEARHFIIDKVSEHDDDLASTILENDSLENISTNNVIKGIRSCVANQTLIPVFCGSAYKNIAIQPLMDAVILYMPSPNERNNDYKCFSSQLCARAFKIIHDKQRGPLVFFRIYSGSFKAGQKIYNIPKDISEQSGKLFVAYADDFENVERLDNGNIAVVTGLKKTMTGDLITTSASYCQSVRSSLDENSDQYSKVFCDNARIPPPVFFCSIEPPSLAFQNSLDQALCELQREDPSLHVTNETDTGQTVLGGMGELHLEIIKDRILKEYKVDADLGPLQISYRETPLNKVTGEQITDTKIGNSKQSVRVCLSLIPKKESEIKSRLVFDKTSEAASELAKILPKHLSAAKQGVDVALLHGPKIGCAVIDVQIMLHMLIVGRGTSESIISATVTQCIQKLLKESGTMILEPIMSLEIGTPEECLSSVMADLNRRRAVIQNVGLRGINKEVTTEAPLSELMGYSTLLRTLTSGTGSFSMEFLEYKAMSSMDEQKAIEAVRGF